MRPRQVPGSSRAFLIKVIVPAIAAVAAIGWASLSMVPALHPARPAARTTPTPMAVRAALIESGITADALCAAGVQSTQVAQVVSDAGSYLEDHGTALSDAKAAVSAAAQAVTQVERKVQVGAASPEEIASLAQLRATLESDKAGLETARANVFNAATASLSEGPKTLLGHIRANHKYQLPVQYAVVDREPADWTKLRRAVQARDITTRRGTTLKASQVTLLAAADEQSDVAAGASNLSQHGEAVRTAWEAALAQ